MDRRGFLGLTAGAALALTVLPKGSAMATVRPRVAAHRGAFEVSGIRENTLKAFQYAKPYASMLETDVRWTEDGLMVLSHDDTVDRLTSKTGYVSNYTLSELKALGYTSFGQFLTYAATIPELLSIEMKDRVGTMRIKKVLAAIARYGISPSRVIMNTFYAEDIKDIQGLMPSGMRTAWGIRTGTWPSTSTLKSVDASFVYSNVKDLTASRSNLIRSLGMVPVVWNTKPDGSNSEQCLDSGASWVLADDPKRFSTWLDTRL